MTTSNSSYEEVRQTISEDTTVQPFPQEEVIKKEDYVNLQSDYTKKSQALIEITLERGRENPKSILDIKDAKLQNKVISEIYGLNSISELKAIYGDEFYKQRDEADMDDLERMKREIAILKNTSESSKLENAIKELKSTNKELFASADAEDKLRDALQLLSTTINTEERVRLASRLVFGNIVNPTSVGYQALQNANVSGGSGGAGGAGKIAAEDKNKELRNFLGLK